MPNLNNNMACPMAYMLKCFFHRKYRYYFWISLLFFYIFVAYVWQTHKKTPELDYVVVHFDLKGAPPKMNYFVTLLKVFGHYGVNALLMEYEDMFPFYGKIKKLRSENSYNEQELTDFLKQAYKEGYTIIPLVQTFGHLEFLLKHKEFENLRENPNFSDSICPSKAKSEEVIHDMLSQIIRFHEKVAPLKYLHIGCDEVYNINLCDSCRDRNLTNLTIFKDHVTNVVNIVHSIQPRLKILIWDDMLRGCKIEFIKPMKLDIEPVSWHYASTVEATVHDLYKYQINFKNIWIASAFKGADGESLLSPVLSERFRNHYSWMQLLNRYSGLQYNFKGIILTGWSRYNHTAPLCELLIPSIPSLLTNLMVVKMYKSGKYDDYFQNWADFFKNNLKKDLYDNLACKIDDQFLISEEIDCSYPGSRTVNNAITAYKQMDKAISKFVLDFKMMSKLSNYTFAIIHYKNILFQADLMKRHVDSLQQDLWKAITEYFPKHVASEYVMQHTKHLKAKVDAILMETHAYKNKSRVENLTLTKIK